MRKEDLPDLLYNIIKKLGGSAIMMEVFREFWNEYDIELQKSGDLFYTWNYDIRWAATELRKQGRMKPAGTKKNPRGLNESPKGLWEII